MDRRIKARWSHQKESVQGSIRTLMVISIWVSGKMIHSVERGSTYSPRIRGMKDRLLMDSNMEKAVIIISRGQSLKGSGSIT